MALQGDQRALLQLLVERGQSYSDIAGLLGTSPEDVRAKARAALAELGGADPDAEVGLTDYLLGQADPIGRADAVRFLQSDPEAHALATRIEDELRGLAPAAKLPKLPEPRGKARRAAAPAPGSAEERPRQDDSDGPAESGASTSRQRRTIAGLAGAGVILVFVILAVAGVFSGDDDSGASDSASTTASADGSTDGSTDAEQPAQNVTEVDLKAVDGSGVAGTAAFGIVDQSQLYVDLSIDGIDPRPAEKEAGYFFWLMIGDQGGYPLPQPLTPDENGRVSGRIAVPTAVASTVAGQADSVKVSLSPVDDLAAAARQAARDQVPIVGFTGTELATGKIPLVAPTDE